MRPRDADNLAACATGIKPPYVDGRTAEQREADQGRQFYSGYGTVGVGKTTGFSKGQFAHQVPKGKDRKKLRKDSKFNADGTRKTNSPDIRRRVQDQVDRTEFAMIKINDGPSRLKRAIVKGVYAVNQVKEVLYRFQ